MRISRGFRGRRRDVDPSRVPPGQYVVEDFPVLSAGPTPRTPLDEWSLTIAGAVEEPASWTWEELLALPQETFTVDIHCVTKWSKLDTTWTGVSLDTLLADVATEADYLTAWCDGDYTTNLDARGRHRRARVDRPHVRRRAARPRARRAGAPAGPAPVPLEEREVGARPEPDRPGRARLLGGGRLPQPRRPMAGAAVLERLVRPLVPIVWRDATVREVIEETPRARTLVLDVPGLARPRRRPARRRAADRRGRLPGVALVLDRVGARGRAGRDHRRAARGRRGLAVPGRGGARGRRLRGSRPDRRALHAGASSAAGRCCWSAAAPAPCR